MITTEQIFHIYDESGVVAHNITVDEMEEIISEPGWFAEQRKKHLEVQPLEVLPDREEHSY
jgi:hypothetical protein